MKEFEHVIISTIDNLGAHPIIGTSISLISASFGMLLNSTGYVDNGIPDGIKDIFQMIAWICTITISALTIIGWLKNNKPTIKKFNGKRKTNRKKNS